MKRVLPHSKPLQGFTLVELLVVVAIIAILTAIGVTVFTNVQKGARDARRVGDIDAVASALETSYSPGPGTYSLLTGGNFSSGKVPTDPIGGATYFYTAYSSTTNFAGSDPTPSSMSETAVTIVTEAKVFAVCARLEIEINGNGNATDKKGTSGTTGLSFYCRKNQQG